MSKRHVLVTGGCGFIGGHFVARVLRTTDWNITVLDGLSYAADVNRLACLPEYDARRVKLAWHDLRAPVPPELTRRGGFGPVDYIVAFAAESHVDRSIKDPVPFIHNNVMVALHTLELSRAIEPEKLVLVSTDEVYGPAPAGVKHKEWDAHIPSNPYASSKAAADDLAVGFWRTYGVPLLSIRAMNTFGERQHPEKYIPKCIRLLTQGKPVPVHASFEAVEGKFYDGHWVSGSRFWLHADSHSSALLFLLNNTSPAKYGQADRPDRYHVVGEAEWTNLEVVQKIAAILGVPARYEYVDFHSSRPGHDLRYALDGTKLAELGWIGSSAEKDLEKTVAWYVKEGSWRNG